MNLKSLSAVTLALFIVSIFVYRAENHRGTDLQSGSDFIKGLDVSKIDKISLSFKEQKKITLTRDSDKFVLEDHSSYPAATDKVNDLIYKVASISVAEKVADGVSGSDLEKFELDEKGRKYLVEIFDNDGKKTVAFSVGKSKKGRGNYLLKEGGDVVYLSTTSLWINSSYKDFIDTVLLDISKDDIERIALKSDSEIVFSKGEESFEPDPADTREFKKEKFDEYAAAFSSVRFDEFYPFNEEKVKDLTFDKDVKVQLKSKLVYKVSLAKSDEDEHFVKINALVENVPERIVVDPNASKEEIQKIDDMVKAQEKAGIINSQKGSWVFKVDKSVYEKLVKDSNFFM